MIVLGIGAALATEVAVDPPGDARNPAWSPDGRDLAFEVHRDDGSVDLYLSRDGGPASRVVIHGATVGSRLVNPHPTGGGAVVFEADRGTDAWRIWRWAPDGVAMLSRGLLGEHRHVAADDEGALAFVRRTDENAEIWLHPTDESAHRLTWTLADESSPAFAPDRDRIAYQRTWEGAHAIVVQERDTTYGVAIAEGERPVWAWDDVVYFHGDAIAVVTPGGDPRALATGVRRPSRAPPTVTPDGAWVLWSDGERVRATAVDGELAIDLPLAATGVADLAVADRDGQLLLAYTAGEEGAHRLHVEALRGPLRSRAPSTAPARAPRRQWAPLIAACAAAAAAATVVRRRRSGTEAA